MISAMISATRGVSTPTTGTSERVKEGVPRSRTQRAQSDFTARVTIPRDACLQSPKSHLCARGSCRVSSHLSLSICCTDDRAPPPARRRGPAWPVPVPACASCPWAPSSSSVSVSRHTFLAVSGVSGIFPVARAPQPAVGDHSTAHQILEGGRAPHYLHWPNVVKHALSAQH